MYFVNDNDNENVLFDDNIQIEITIYKHYFITVFSYPICIWLVPIIYL